MNYFHYRQPFQLECGAVLPELTIAYSTYGAFNKNKSNVVWVCHALTANSNALDWWPGVVGTDGAISPEDYYIVCANIIGSCYGTTGPLSANPATGEVYYHDFPFITIRDMVAAHILLRQYLHIETIELVMGGSMGGYQALEWCLMEPTIIRNLFLIASSAHESPWGIAIHTAQRLTIEADTTWKQPSEKSGQKGLQAARAIGMITYRTYDIYAARQTEEDNNKVDNFKAASYIQYQGTKLVNRFNAYSYWLLTKAMDSHNIARNRYSTIEETLETITQPTLIIGITSDILCPVKEQQFMADHMPHSTYIKIDSIFGHDGFLVEAATIAAHIKNWLEKNKK